MLRRRWARVVLFVVLALGAVGGASYSLRSGTPEPSTAESRRSLERSTASSARTEQNEASSSREATAREATAKGSEVALDEARPNVERQRADLVRQRVAKRRAMEHARSNSDRTRVEPALRAAPGHAASTPEEAQRRREYMNRAVREQYFPVARSCYEELLGRDPKAAGKVVVSFAIVGDGDAGVVDRVELGDDTTIDDPEFTQCMRESMYTSVFEPPPPGASETTVVYPIELSP